MSIEHPKFSDRVEQKIDGIPRSQLITAFKVMLRARKVDLKSIVLYKQNKCHFQIGCAGHEVVQVAAAHCLKPRHDWAYPYYRDMAFCLALGMTTREMLLGVLNKALDPSSGGRQMPSHFGHSRLNIPSQSSPTGTQFLQAVGMGGGCLMRGLEQVVYVSCGEGTTAQGDYHEALNWAAKGRLPVIFLIQNNNYAISTHISEQLAGADLCAISSGYQGLEVREIDGLNYVESYHAITHAVERARRGDGPSTIIANVVRLQSHSISDNQEKYRTPEEIERDKRHDPVDGFRRYLLRKGVFSEEEIMALEAKIDTQINEDAEWAERQADPSVESATSFVEVLPDPLREVVEVEPHGEEVFMVDALNHALDEELKKQPEMMIFGQDVAGAKGGVFTVTSDLSKKYGRDRVFNSPLAEASICGAAIGIATGGFRPVAEIQFGDYIWTGMMQIRNELAMMHYRSNGSWRLPVVIRVAVGGYIRGGIYHSQNIEGTFAHFPGLTIIMPSNATDAKGLLKSAIRSPNPVLFLEHKGLYRQVFAKGKEGGPEDLIPIGRAKVVRPGEHVTLITWGMLVHFAKRSAEQLIKEGISVEIIDLRTLVPLDDSLILQSVKKTARVLIAQEDVLFMGYGAEISARITEAAFSALDAPVARIGAANCPIPHAPILEQAVLPQIEDISNAIRKLVNY